MQSGKLHYLEGLRGVAALQVALMHFVLAFMPVAAEHAWPPLRPLFDGHTAVYVFFLISGAVLTPSFARAGAFLTKLLKRIVRLGIPVAAAAAIATALLALLPDAHLRAASLTGSAWLAMDSSGAPTLSHLAREIGLNSLLLGYREVTLFAPLASDLPPMQRSLDAPFWSLHLELYGSLLVLCLVTLRAHSISLHLAAVVAAALTFGTHPMFLFVLGHLLPLPRDSGGARRAWFGGAMLALGLALCMSKDWAAVEWLRLAFVRTEFAYAPNLYQFQSELGAIAVYGGVLLCGRLWPALESSPLRHLGRLSFSVYLLHFPILFSLVCAAYTEVPSVPAAFLLYVALTVIAALSFERLIDRPAIALSRRAAAYRRNAITSASA